MYWNGYNSSANMVGTMYTCCHVVHGQGLHKSMVVLHYTLCSCKRCDVPQRPVLSIVLAHRTK